MDDKSVSTGQLEAFSELFLTILLMLLLFDRSFEWHFPDKHFQNIVNLGFSGLFSDSSLDL